MRFFIITVLSVAVLVLAVLLATSARFGCGCCATVSPPQSTFMVPEPATLALVGLALVAVAVVTRRKP